MLNKALRLIRVYHDMNLSDAAERVGLSKSYISEMERGHKKVTLDVLEKYSAAFDIPVSSLMLFAERAEEGGFSEDTRAFVADKALKMLDWIATISSDRENDQHA
ncbi:MAG: XRE family transcriptional regulator [Alphaproteobacteria bacterium]|nr:MAG: XRE family transcriptional regulator [Alphaproteobacteria bacterium]